MNQNIFCSKCHRIPSQCCCSSVKEHDMGISHAIGFDDGFKAGMQRAVEMNVIKELTDAEITEISKEIFKDYKNFHHYQIDFARAVLEAAQKK